MGTGWHCASMPLAGAEIKARGVRGLSLALPGCGCTSWSPTAPRRAARRRLPPGRLAAPGRRTAGARGGGAGWRARRCWWRAARTAPRSRWPSPPRATSGRGCRRAPTCTPTCTPTSTCLTCRPRCAASSRSSTRARRGSARAAATCAARTAAASAPPAAASSAAAAARACLPLPSYQLGAAPEAQLVVRLVLRHDLLQVDVVRHHEPPERGAARLGGERGGRVEEAVRGEVGQDEGHDVAPPLQLPLLLRQPGLVGGLQCHERGGHGAGKRGGAGAGRRWGPRGRCARHTFQPFQFMFK